MKKRSSSPPAIAGLVGLDRHDLHGRVVRGWWDGAKVTREEGEGREATVDATGTPRRWSDWFRGIAVRKQRKGEWRERPLLAVQLPRNRDVTSARLSDGFVVLVQGTGAGETRDGKLVIHATLSSPTTFQFWLLDGRRVPEVGEGRLEPFGAIASLVQARPWLRSPGDLTPERSLALCSELVAEVLGVDRPWSQDGGAAAASRWRRGRVVRVRNDGEALFVVISAPALLEIRPTVLLAECVSEQDGPGQVPVSFVANDGTTRRCWVDVLRFSSLNVREQQRTGPEHGRAVVPAGMMDSDSLEQIHCRIRELYG